ncbi:MAG TPA: TonB-dependent receptor plug domain-containing protein [Salinimicrobium sp.]|nr:TonB-dependent receptor plug domain-containing protein [Salinimicrobium sp.]
MAPNFYAANPGDKRNVVYIRGIINTSYEPAVATYIDGVNQFSLDTYITHLFDIERIEILRGPQGSLYGRNAMGGVINIISKETERETSLFRELTLGDHQKQELLLRLRTLIVDNKLFFASWRYIGQQYFDLANTMRQGPYRLFNGQLGYSYKSWILSLWGKNIFNQLYISYGYSFGAVHLGDPATFGATLSFQN